MLLRVGQYAKSKATSEDILFKIQEYRFLETWFSPIAFTISAEICEWKTRIKLGGVESSHKERRSEGRQLDSTLFPRRCKLCPLVIQ